MRPGSRLECVLRHRLIASAGLLALLGVVYWDGCWRPPRHDQLVYLYEASRFPRFLDRLAYSPAWNRVVSVPGDQILYRPVLYLLLASEHALFGMNFFLWQAAGIGLHAAQTLLLHRMFLQRA